MKRHFRIQTKLSFQDGMLAYCLTFPPVFVSVRDTHLTFAWEHFNSINEQDQLSQNLRSFPN
jgi:hypothetical protein